MSNIDSTLAEFADAAERVIQDIEAGAPERARLDAARLNNLAHEEGAIAPTVAASLRSRTTAVAGLAARRAPPLAVAQAANGVAGLIARRPRAFAQRAELALGYLEREARLRSMAHQHRAVAAAVEEAVAMWPGLRRTLIAGGDRELAERFDAHLERLSHCQGAADIRDETQRGLELIARMRSRADAAIAVAA